MNFKSVCRAPNYLLVLKKKRGLKLSDQISGISEQEIALDDLVRSLPPFDHKESKPLYSWKQSFTELQNHEADAHCETCIRHQQTCQAVPTAPLSPSLIQSSLCQRQRASDEPQVSQRLSCESQSLLHFLKARQLEVLHRSES